MIRIDNVELSPRDLRHVQVGWWPLDTLVWLQRLILPLANIALFFIATRVADGPAFG